MQDCVICEKPVSEHEAFIEDAKQRVWHERCLRAALSEFDKWGIDMMRQFANSLRLSIGAMSR